MIDSRLSELGAWRTPLGVRDLWAAICRAQLVEGGASWLTRWLWRYRYASWVVSLDTGSCVVCGVSVKRRRSDARYCGIACAARARRLRRSGEPTPHQQRSSRAADDLRVLESDLDLWRHWIAKMDAIVLPPDLLDVDNLPALPERCGGGCTRRACCAHTGSICLFAGTRSGQ